MLSNRGRESQPGHYIEIDFIDYNAGRVTMRCCWGAMHGPWHTRKLFKDRHVGFYIVVLGESLPLKNFEHMKGTANLLEEDDFDD